jgi:hypothetical protein
VTWLAWRQLRASAIAVALALVTLFVVLWVSGSQLLHVYDSSVVHCGAHHDCGPVGAHFLALGHLTHVLSTLVLAAPILVGVFWGAPLVARELETGTYRLVWTQSVTRLRWIVVRLAVVLAATVVVMGLLSLAVTWWQHPLDQFNDAPFSNFEARDVVPVAYGAFGFMLGVLLGAVVKRTLVAMAGTIVGFVTVRYLIAQYVRPNLMTPLRASSPLNATLTSTGGGFSVQPPAPGDWVTSDQIVTGSGRVVGSSGLIGGNGDFGVNVHRDGTVAISNVGRCANRIPLVRHDGRYLPGRGFQPAIQRCLDSFDLRHVMTYQPPSHYWPLQWSEAAIFLAITIALGAACVWVVRRRLP